MIRVVVVVAAAATLTGTAAAWPPHSDMRDPHVGAAVTHTQRSGYGVIRFDGAGAEKWAYRYRVEHRKRLRAERENRRLLNATFWSPLERAFLCIHRGEGSWGADTGNGYYGGLQMDREFQRTYGPEFVRAFGWANDWPVSVQLAVAIKAHFTRGYWPWPNTARACGLLP